MSKVNITIAGATYSDVPAITAPRADGGTAKYVEISDTTADATDVLAGKTFYGADGKLATGVHDFNVTQTTGDVNIYSDEAWKVDVKQAAHQTITATPKMEWNQENDGRYRAKFYTPIDNLTIKADTGYVPGTITQTVDKVKQTITVSSTDAELIEPLVKDGWVQVYQKQTGYEAPVFYDTPGGSQLAPDALVGKVLITGMEGKFTDYTTQYAPYSGTWLTDYTKTTAYRNDFATSMPSLGISYWHNIREIYLKNLTGEIDYGFLVGCESLKKVEIGDVTAFGYSTFLGCEALEEIILHAASVPTVDMYACHEFYMLDGKSFSGVPSTCKLYVPASAVDAYKADSVWGTQFEDRIFAIEETA